LVLFSKIADAKSESERNRYDLNALGRVWLQHLLRNGLCALLTLTNCHLNLHLLARSRTVPCYTSTHLLDGANGVSPRVSRRAHVITHVTRQTGVRDRVEAGGGAVGARAGRLVLGVEDDVLGRLAAARAGEHAWRAQHLGAAHHIFTTRATYRQVIGLGYGGIGLGLGLGHDHTRTPSAEWL
jgi:hypothetical protein